MANFDTVDITVGGQAAKILVPNANSAHPYNAALRTNIIYQCHAANQDATSVLAWTAGIAAFTNAGWMLADSNQHGLNWGNTAGLDDMIALDVYCRTNYNIGDAVMWGVSMGGLASLLCVAAGTIPNIVGWFGHSPACSLAAVYNGTGGTDFSSDINTAYSCNSGTYAAATAGHDPLLVSAASFAGKLFRAYANDGRADDQQRRQGVRL